MIYLQLFLSFFQIGLFSFGGGYAAMPLIQGQVVQGHGWLSMSEFTDLITIAVIEESGITKRHDIHFIYVRRICKYSTNGTDSKTGHCNAQGDQADEKDSDKRNMCPFSHHGRAGNKRIPFLRGRFFSVVHDKPPL